MAKAGLDYFPLDVTMDSKIELIEAEFGLTGFGVVVHLLQEIYGKAGYYIEWTNEVALLFARKVGVGGSAVSEIVEASIRRGMFDKELYDKYHVLTSKGIQKRYFEAVSRRKQLEVDENILLVDCTQFLRNADIKRVNVNILSKNSDKNKQSKVEESKVEESKVKEDCWGFGENLTKAFSDWLQYKQEKRQGYKQKGLESLLSQVKKKAQEYGEDAVADLIAECMASNWQGIIWDKLKSKHTAGTQGRKSWAQIAAEMDEEEGNA